VETVFLLYDDRNASIDTSCLTENLHPSEIGNLHNCEGHVSEGGDGEEKMMEAEQIGKRRMKG
jgi:hypothetical protein